MFTSASYGSNRKSPDKEPGAICYLHARGQLFSPILILLALFSVLILFRSISLLVKYGPDWVLCISITLCLIIVLITHTQILRTRVTGLYLALMQTFYLNSFPIKRIYDVCTMRRLGIYIGHGLCFETSALMMLISKYNQSSRLVVADAVSPERFRRYRHAWVEVKLYGMYWVIDPSWGHLFIYPRFLYRLRTHPHYRRVVKHRDFWKTMVANTLYLSISDVDSSFVFWNLVTYRPINSRNIVFNYEKYGQRLLLQNINVFHTQEASCEIGAMLYYSFERVSITKEIFDSFVINPLITEPDDELVDFAKPFEISILDLQSPA